MPRMLRRDLPDGTYHVVTRGVDGAPIVRDDHDRRAFVRLLGNTSTRYSWRCLVWCLMTNHYHLVVETTCSHLSEGACRLNGIYAQRFNRRHNRTGHLFERRFSAWLLDDEGYLQRTCDYVWNNPVRAGLCETPDEWPWSAALYLEPDIGF